MTVPLRKCKHCGKEALTMQDLHLFAPSKGCYYGKQNTCRDCSRVYYRNYVRRHYPQNRERCLEYAKRHNIPVFIKNNVGWNWTMQEFPEV